MKRRDWLGAFARCAAALPLAARSQSSASPRIGWLSAGRHPFIEDFRQGLAELDYRDARIEERYPPEDRPDALPPLARELVADKVDVIVTSGVPAALAAKQATTSIPIVAVTASHVELGLVASLAHPGANLTGLAIMSSELAAKWLELLHEAVRGVSRVAVLRDASGRYLPQWESVQAAALSLGVAVLPLDVHRLEDFEPVLVDAANRRAEGLVVLASPFFAANKARIVALAAWLRLPAIYEHADFAEAGGLMSYGPDLHLVFRRAAAYVDRILKGTKPAELPVEQPTRFETVVNLRAAREQGIAIAPSFMLRADRVIE
jgi:putative ABC transport system substrate-binding protein